MATGSFALSDLNTIHDVVQNNFLSFPKEITIAVLREEFSKDDYFHYVKDAWGFANVPDLTDLPQDAGLNDDATTRVYIGEYNRYDKIYYPAIIVKTGAFNSVPISINREKGTVQNEFRNVVDGYGNVLTQIVTPKHFIFAGVWEGQINIEVLARGIQERDELTQFVALIFRDIRWEEMMKSGVAIKPRVSISAGSESEDRNDKLYRNTVTLDIRFEWRRHIPVSSVVDAINLCVDFGNLAQDPPILAPNISIRTTVELLDAFQNI